MYSSSFVSILQTSPIARLSWQLFLQNFFFTFPSFADYWSTWLSFSYLVFSTEATSSQKRGEQCTRNFMRIVQFRKHYYKAALVLRRDDLQVWCSILVLMRHVGAASYHCVSISLPMRIIPTAKLGVLRTRTIAIKVCWIDKCNQTSHTQWAWDALGDVGSITEEPILLLEEVVLASRTI